MHVGEETRDPSDDDGSFGPWIASHERDGGECVPASSAAPVACRASTSVVEGVVRRVDGDSLWLGRERVDRRGTETGVRHELPSRLRLDALVGQMVRVTVVREPRPLESEESSALDRTLTVTGERGRVWLIARTGTVRGVTHVISPSVSFGAALSQRPSGPLVIGTSELQWLVSPGTTARLPVRDGSAFRLLLVERRPDDTASYVLADERLFAEEWS